MSNAGGDNNAIEDNNAGGDNGATDERRTRRHDRDEVEDFGTERLLPEEVDESMTDLLFGDVESLRPAESSSRAD